MSLIEITVIVESKDLIILKLKGDIDASSSIRLDKELEAAVLGAYNRILIDCTHLDYISSAGLGVFMSYIHELEEKKITLILFGIAEKVFEIFSILGLSEIMNIVKDKQEALNLKYIGNN